MKKIGKLIWTEIIVMLLLPVFICLFDCGPLFLKIIAALSLVHGFLFLIFVSGYGRLIPMKAFFLYKIFLPLTIFSAKIFKIKSTEVMSYFVVLNNALYPLLKGKTLLLLPKCLQNATCGKDVISDINNCVACGRCQIPEIITLCKDKNIVLFLAGGGRLAVEKISKEDPDGVIAVACEVELIEGINAVPNKPIVVVNVLRPNGPCKDTQIIMNELEELIARCV